MKSVYKYTFPINDIIELSLPPRSHIIHVDTQDDGYSKTIAVWALVNVPVEKYLQQYKIRIAGTGHPIDNASEQLKYINTFTMLNKNLWFHAFEIL